MYMLEYLWGVAVIGTGLCPLLECYPYMEDLKKLDQRSSCPSSHEIPQILTSVSSPLRAEEWARGLHQHSDKEFSLYVMNEICKGFKIGFGYHKCSCRSAQSNMRSAVKNPIVVEEYLAMESELDRVVGPLDPKAFPHIQINRFGVIPKPHQPGKWQLIVDLSYPEGGSVNDGIPPELCSLRYPSVDDVVRVILTLRMGTKLAKFDIQSAYRIVPICPSDRHLLGMVLRVELFVDTALLFGLRSVPKISQQWQTLCSSFCKKRVYNKLCTT